MNAAVNSSAGLPSGERFVAVRYIGKKPSKTDTILNRPNLKWSSPGDVRWVPERDAVVYIGYADIWAIAHDVERPEGGIMGLADVSAAARGYASDLKSTNRLPGALNRGPDPEFESDAKAESPLLSGLQEFAKSAAAEKLTLEAVTAKLARLIEAVPQLRPGEFEPNGKPKAIGLTRVLKMPVSRVERDIVWNMICKQRDKLHAEVPVTETEPAPGGTDGGDADVTSEAAADVQADAVDSIAGQIPE